MGQDLGFYDYHDWFGPYFDGRETLIPRMPSYILRLKRAMTHRVIGLMTEHDVVSAIAVYLADMFLPGQPAREVVAKLYMQIPNLKTPKGDPRGDRYELSSDPKVYAAQASRELEEFENERLALRHLTSAGCSSTPHLITEFDMHNPYVEGGHLYVIVMEKLPGKPLSEVWNPNKLSLATQKLIQERFLYAILEVFRLGITHTDPQPRNLLWDEKNDKCYIIDFEDHVLREDIENSQEYKIETEEEWFDLLSAWGLINKEMRLKFVGY